MECICQSVSKNKFVVVFELVLFSWFLWLIKGLNIVIFLICYHEYTENFGQFGSCDYLHAEIPTLMLDVRNFEEASWTHAANLNFEDKSNYVWFHGQN